MDGRSDASVDEQSVQIASIPEGLGGGATVLVAHAGDPTAVSICLRILSQYGTVADTALVVSTTESADRTIETSDSISESGNQPSLGIVDTVSAEQSITAMYDQTPVVYTPAQGDLERLVMALSELSGTNPPDRGARHLVVRSLSPILNASSVDSVSAVLGRITGLRSERGLCLLGLDYTAHDEETMVGLVDQVDGILWVTRSDADRLELEYRPARAYGCTVSPGSNADD